MTKNHERILTALQSYDETTLMACNWHAHAYADMIGVDHPGTGIWETGEDFDYVDLPHAELNPDHEFFYADSNGVWHSAEKPSIDVNALAAWLAAQDLNPEPFETVRPYGVDYMHKDFEFIFDEFAAERSADHV